MTFNPSGLTEKQLNELRELLETKLTALESDIGDLEDDLTETENSQQGAPDEVDRSSFEEEMQRMQLMLNEKHKLRKDVLDAVRKFDEGEYGICEESEEPISFSRLKVQPWTRFSLEAQQEIETRIKNRSGGPRADNPFGSAYSKSADD